MATQAPLVYSTALGHPRRIAAGDTIDPAYIPATTGSTQRTFAYFMSRR